MELAGIIFVLLLSIACGVISVLQFKERGFLFHNAYICATKQERENMDKSPYYRQSGIVFALLSAMFLCVCGECILKTGWLWWMEGVLAAAVLIYAIASAVKGQMKR